MSIRQYNFFFSQNPTQIAVAERHPDKLFQFYTNGTLITKEVTRHIAAMGNLVPLVSVHGFQKETDAIRGNGVYERVMRTMDYLTQAGVVWGISFVLTSQNIDVFDAGFLDTMVEKGAMLGRFLTYMPTGRGSDWNLVPTPNQREKQGEILRTFNSSGIPFFGIDYMNNPDFVKGCQAAGIRYVYVDSEANVYPCVFLPVPSIFNLKDAYQGVYSQQGLEVRNLMDILIKDPLFRKIRELAKQRDDHKCCLIIDNPAELKEACSMLAFAYPVSDFSGFFQNELGQAMLKEYISLLRNYAR